MPKSNPTPIYPVHVICCNDAVMFVVIGTDAQARDRLEVEALRDWQTGYKWKYPEYKTYRRLLYWHLNTVNGEMYGPV